MQSLDVAVTSHTWRLDLEFNLGILSQDIRQLEVQLIHLKQEVNGTLLMPILQSELNDVALAYAQLWAHLQQIDVLVPIPHRRIREVG